MNDLLPYHASLGALGRILDTDRASLLTLCEIHGGFLLHYLRNGDPGAVTSQALPYSDVLDLVDTMPVQGTQRPWLARLRTMGRRERRAPGRQQPELVSQGYAVTLPALGHTLDRRRARAVVVVELDDAVQVEYTVERATTQFRHGQRVVASGRYAQTYTAAQLDDAASTRRAQIDETVRRAGIHLAENPADVTACLAGAAALEEAGDLAEATRLYRHAVAMVPTLQEAHYHLARLAFRRGDMAATLRHLREATAEDSGDGRPFHLLARLRERRGEPLAAVQALEQAVARDPGNPLYAFEMERLLDKTGSTRVVDARHGVNGTIEQDNVYSGDTECACAVPTPAMPADEAPAVRHPLQMPQELPLPAPGSSGAAAAPGDTEPDRCEPAGNAGAARPASPGDLSGHNAGDMLPVLGLAVTNEWEQPAWPSLQVPADSAMAATALPLTVGHLSHVLPQHDTAPMDGHDRPAGAGETYQ